jgi:hypothetical protein
MFSKGLTASPVAWTSFKALFEITKLQFDLKIGMFSAVKFLQFAVIKTLDLDPDPH